MESVRILYVEDDPADRELTLHHLRRQGPDLEVRAVGTGREALEALRGGGVDVVLLDYRLPDVDGLQLLREIQAAVPETPVIMLTGSGDHEVAVAALKAGTIDYVIKQPSYLERLPALIRGALGRFRHERRRRAAGLRILYAEHDPADVELALRHFLAHAPHLSAETAGTGAAALRKLEAGGFDLLLLDYRMPDRNGLEILQEMRARGIRLPVVMVTGHGDEETAVQALKLGAADYVVKREGYLTQLPSTIESAVAQRALADEKEALLTLNGLAVAVASALDLDEVLRLVAGAAATLLKVERSLVSLLGQDGAALLPAAWHGTPAEVAGRLRFRVGEGVPGRAAAERRAVSVPDIRLAEAAVHREVAVFEGVGGLLSVPVLARGQLLGVVTAAATGPRPFTSWEEAVLTALAAHAAVGIENARLYGEAVEQTERLRGLIRTSAKIAGTLQAEEVLHSIAEEAAKLLRCDGAGFRLLEGDQLVVGGKYGLAHHVMVKPSLRMGESLTGQVAEEGRPIAVPDLREDQAYLPEHKASALAHGVVGYLGVPLRSRGRLIGVLNVYRQDRWTIHEGEVDLLSAFADQAAVAIENARLLAQTQRHAADLEERVRARTRELEAANQQLAAASQHKSEFLANMSHELRTPLNSIIGFSEVLRDLGVGPLNEKQARYLGNIWQSGKHLLRLINDILDLSKVEAGKVILEPEPLDVGAALEEILVIARGLAHQKAQTIEARIEPGLPPLRADPVRFKQVCFNLLSNAVKFTPEEGRITLAARRAPGAADLLEIQVTDTGIGIKAADLPRLFQEFVQLEAMPSKRHEGTGLGLALSKRLVELHGGRIRAESAGEGRGTTFTFVLPFAGPGKAPEAPPAGASS